MQTSGLRLLSNPERPPELTRPLFHLADTIRTSLNNIQVNRWLWSIEAASSGTGVSINHIFSLTSPCKAAYFEMDRHQIHLHTIPPRFNRRWTLISGLITDTASRTGHRRFRIETQREEEEVKMPRDRGQQGNVGALRDLPRQLMQDSYVLTTQYSTKPGQSFCSPCTQVSRNDT